MNWGGKREVSLQSPEEVSFNGLREEKPTFHMETSSLQFTPSDVATITDVSYEKDFLPL